MAAMNRATDRRRDSAERFRQRYGLQLSESARIVEREVIGADMGANGYTTIAQADLLASRLELHSGKRLLDLGSGRGWPGNYLAQTTGCDVVLSDVPDTALRFALKTAEDMGTGEQVRIARATATRLPFADGTFDAVCHTDTL
jgi:SAM-dependent methyltransferase